MYQESTPLKYIFVAGLEHSGTTLLCHLLASQERVLALGEVAQFFSSGHMKNYFSSWSEYEDVTRCSCGVEWRICSFWSALIDLNGKFDVHDIDKGYQSLFSCLNSSELRQNVIVDSSKSFQYLKSFLKAIDTKLINRENILIVVLTKDPRGFAHSISRKSGHQYSLLASWKAINWWNSIYTTFIRTWKSWKVPVIFCTYEQLCNRPDLTIGLIGKRVGLEFNRESRVSNNLSHIALGNKNFIERNRSKIRYDNAWKHNWRVKVAYWANWRAIFIMKKFLKLEKSAQYDG